MSDEIPPPPVIFDGLDPVLEEKSVIGPPVWLSFARPWPVSPRTRLRQRLHGAWPCPVWDSAFPGTEQPHYAFGCASRA